MSLLPVFEIGFWNAWLFMIIYPLQWLAVIVVPKTVAERTSHAPDIIRSRRDRVMAFFTQGLWVGATLYSIFIPLKTGEIWIWIGLTLFAIGLSTLISATIAVARTPNGSPFSSGIYRVSRHPMYLSMMLVYLAVSIAAASWLFFLITFATFFLQRYQAKKEEKYCCEQFGRAYVDYMERTSRWIGLPGRGSDGQKAMA
jgi:protein-S-isoprenylcysteine O-methyltransferase Ste14